jgi:periplasmic protein TonB
MSNSASAGHVSLDIGGTSHDDLLFSFDQEPRRLSVSVAASIAIDGLILAMLIVAGRAGKPAETRAVDAPAKNIIWLVEPGPGGGGGGGGNKMKAPPRQAELPGKNAVTVPVEKTPKLEQPLAKIEPSPIEQLNIPAKELAAAVDSLPGAIEAPPGPPTLSQGSGSSGGAGTGSGSGIGPGFGSGLGPGSGGGTGGGVYRPGSGVTNPILLREVKPAYTSDAMRAHIQGSVFLECVIKADGSVGEVRVIRSLDAMFGLDVEAIKAARQWRFRPSTRMGEPVPVWVTLQLDFTLR